MRQFLLTNLLLVGDNQYRWKLNFDAIEEALPNLSALEVEPGKSFQGPSLFVYGSLSNYVKPVHFPIIDSLFPKNKKKEILQAGRFLF